MKQFQKVLIANRGEIAARVMRTCRAMGIHTAAVYADPDRDAPFVEAADEAVYIGSPMSSASFLAIDTFIEAARRVGADAIHPGYGFLAENADFAQACADAGLTFIGPTPDAIRRMGSKIEAKKVMTAAGVPVVPGFSAEGLSDREIDTQARMLGFPVLIKASAGGGGKGMRIVNDGAGLTAALAAARREAKSAFGDATLLVERYFESPRHIEVQLLGDAHGTLIHCFERECSIQRRYQKIIEEAPSPAVDPTLRARICAAALSAGRAIQYQNAGTVEFVVDRDGAFYFLEVNTRLQVEHPVTEEITGLDLVRLQILIAQGAPLPVRQEDLSMAGHAIECRIYAEDPAADFLPSTGTIVRWEEPRMNGVRYESGVRTGSAVTIHYDPLLAKIIAHAPTRGEATRKLAKALADMRVDGVRTNVPLLLHVLRHPAFVAGALDTHFISNHVSLGPQSAADRAVDAVHAIATSIWLQERRHAEAPVLRDIPSGWRNNPSQMQEQSFATRDATVCVRYQVRSRHAIAVDLAGQSHVAEVHGWSDHVIVLVLDGVRRTYHVVEHGGMYYVWSTLGSSELREEPRFPTPEANAVQGSCRAPMPGRILAVRVAQGQTVRKGDTLAILEAMKMEHEVVAPHDGVVREVFIEVGQQVEAGDVLAALDEAKGSDREQLHPV
jgi:propionyl-CoA carboxylase alpha chain